MQQVRMEGTLGTADWFHLGLNVPPGAWQIAPFLQRGIVQCKRGKPAPYFLVPVPGHLHLVPIWRRVELLESHLT